MTRTSLRRAAIAAALLSIGLPASAGAAAPDGDGPWADSVVSAQQGKRKDGRAVLAVRSDPAAALGAAERTDVDGTFYSLGFGGELVLRFDNPVCNGGGDDLDLDIVETTDEPYPDEVAKVFVSEDGTAWTPLGTMAVKDEQLALPADVPVAHYVKLVDASDRTATYPNDPDRAFSTNADGYDVDGVAALHPATCADTAPPATTITLAPSSPDGDDGWYVSPVGVTVSATDAGSGIDQTRCALDQPTAPAVFAALPSGCAYLTGGTVGADGTHRVDASSADRAGNTDTPVSASFKIDQAKPTVTYAGNAGTYAVDQTVKIACAAADTGSGVASTTCADVNRPAYEFGLGGETLGASARDVAGNTGTGSTSFTVVATGGSLCRLTKQMIQSTPAYKSMPLVARQVADIKLGVLCGYLECITPKLKAPQKAALVLLYNVAIKGFAGPGGLTNAQVTTLTGLASGI